MSDEYIPPSADLDMKRALRGIWTELKRFRADGKNFDFKGQRLTNIGPGLSGDDSATIRQLAAETNPDAIVEKVRGEFLPSGAPRTQFCLLGRTVAQSIPNATNTVMTWDNELEDRAGMHTGSLSQIIIQQPGLYLVGATLSWQQNVTGVRQMSIFETTGLTLCRVSQNALNDVTFLTVQSCVCARRFNANDTLTVLCQQTSTIALNVTVNANYSPIFWALGFNS